MRLSKQQKQEVAVGHFSWYSVSTPRARSSLSLHAFEISKRANTLIQLSSTEKKLILQIVKFLLVDFSQVVGWVPFAKKLYFHLRRKDASLLNNISNRLALTVIGNHLINVKG